MGKRRVSARSVTKRWMHRLGRNGKTKRLLQEGSRFPRSRKEFGYKNPMEVPRLVKIVVNMGLGEAIQNVKVLDSAMQELTMIVGQKPVITKAKKSIATFKLRQGMSIGCCVTLRSDRMYEFFDRWSASHSRGSAISAGFPRNRSTAEEIRPWAERTDHLSGDRVRQG